MRKNALATRENLVRRRCAYFDLWPICQSRPESVEHLLFGCNLVRAVWFGSNLNFRVNWNSIHSVLEWSCALMEQFQNAVERDLFFRQVVWTGWFIWKGRNDFFFNNQPIDRLSVLYCVRLAKAEFESATGLGVVSRPQSQAAVIPPVTNWVPPSLGNLKVNCDVVVKKGPNQAAVAAILQDSNTVFGWGIEGGIWKGKENRCVKLGEITVLFPFPNPSSNPPTKHSVKVNWLMASPRSVVFYPLSKVKL